MVMERTLDEISRLHGTAAGTWARGILAGAICAMLWPP
jgi:hypothetical protein